LSCLNKYVKKALIHLYCSPGVEGEVRWPPLLPSLRLPPSAGFGSDSFSSEFVSPCSRPSRTLKNDRKEFMQRFLLVLSNNSRNYRISHFIKNHFIKNKWLITLSKISMLILPMASRPMADPRSVKG
jgi:hypothetical protein